MNRWLKRLGWLALAVFALVVLCEMLPPQAGLLVWGLYVLCFFKWRIWFKRLVWAGVGLLGLIVAFGLLLAGSQSKPSSTSTPGRESVSAKDQGGDSTNSRAPRTSEITVAWDQTVVEDCASYPRFADPQARQEAISFATLIGCKSGKVYEREKLEDLSRNQIQAEINAEERVDAEGLSSLKHRYPGIPDHCAATLQSLGIGINLGANHDLGCTKEHVPNILRLAKEKLPGATPPSRKQSATLAPAMDKEARFQLAVAAVKQLKAAMRNPDSFKLVQVMTLDDGTSCYEYRAQNGFGGTNVGQAVVTPKGRLATSDAAGFSSLWKKSCANKSGEDNTWKVGYAAGLHGLLGGRD